MGWKKGLHSKGVVEEEKVPCSLSSVLSSLRIHCCSNTLSLLCSVFSPSGRASLSYWNSRAALATTLRLTRQHDKQIHLLTIPSAAAVARNCSVPFRLCFHFCGSHGRKWNAQLSASVRRDRKTICPEGFRRNLSKGNGFFLFIFFWLPQPIFLSQICCLLQLIGLSAPKKN